jgi:hypothetical protein
MSVPILAGWTPVGRGRERHFTRNGARCIQAPFDGAMGGPKAWLAIAPGISAAGPTPEAAIAKLRERAARALKATE